MKMIYAMRTNIIYSDTVIFISCEAEYATVSIPSEIFIRTPRVQTFYIDLSKFTTIFLSFWKQIENRHKLFLYYTRCIPVL